jgi:hypothetical protein
MMWTDQRNAGEPNSADTSNEANADGAKSCSDVHLLKDLRIGKPDKLGNKVREILWIEKNYAVYSTDQGVYVQFSDCEEKEREQRDRFTQICPELCELRYLTTQMKGWGWGAWITGHRRHTLYEHNMAQALMLMMEDKVKPAKAIAEKALAMAVHRVTNDNTIRYARACFVTGSIAIAFGAAALWWAYTSHHAEAMKWGPYVMGAMFGAIGAMFSIAMRLEAFDLKPCNESRMNYWMSAIRVVMGIMSAVALLLFADTLLGDVLAKFTGSGKHITDPIGPDAENMVIWQAVALLGFIAGFAERLIPNLLRQTESTIGTPVQAVRSDANRGEAPAGAA